MVAARFVYRRSFIAVMQAAPAQARPILREFAGRARSRLIWWGTAEVSALCELGCEPTSNGKRELLLTSKCASWCHPKIEDLPTRD